jgi:hypothetical protein
MGDSALGVSADWWVALLRGWHWLNPCFRAAAGIASFATAHNWHQHVQDAAHEARTTQ